MGIITYGPWVREKHTIKYLPLGNIFGNFSCSPLICFKVCLIISFLFLETWNHPLTDRLKMFYLSSIHGTNLTLHINVITYYKATLTHLTESCLIVKRLKTLNLEQLPSIVTNNRLHHACLMQGAINHPCYGRASSLP